MLLKEDIHRFISSTELFLRDIRGLRYDDLKKVNFFVGHPVHNDESRTSVDVRTYLTKYDKC